MIWTMLLNLLLIPIRFIAGLIGLLPFVNVGFGSYVTKFMGWSCYLMGSSLTGAIFVSILGWSTVFGAIAIFKFIKNYVPVV